MTNTKQATQTPKPKPTSEDYAEALENFLTYALSIQPKNFPMPVFTVETGRINDRIVLANPHQSAFCFVRKSDGAILKSASWKRPAKHARGTIFNDNDVDAYGITSYGPNHLR